MNLCVACGSESPLEDRFCSTCGARMARECSACGAPATPDAHFCGQCGTAFDGVPEPAEPPEQPPEEEAAVTERRLVTVLFADLVGFTARSEHQDPEDSAAFLREYYDRARDTIERFGGIVEKFAGDAVMAVWGAHRANEDDAERAVRAGLELQDVVAKRGVEAGDWDVNLRVGINTGEAAVRPGGNQSTGMVVGDLVNSASRLQSVADPGSVLVSDATHRAAHHAIAFESAGVRALRGKEEQVATWRALRVVAERRGVGRVEGLDPPFVGRQAELHLLKDLFTDVARDGRARMVSIIGEVGIGKSRLAWELQKYADGLAEPVSWNLGRSMAYGAEGVASRALSDMIRRRIGVSEDEGHAVVVAALDASLDDVLDDAAERSRLRPWFMALLGCGPSPDGDRSEFDAAVRAYFAHLSEDATTVLVFDDLQWADAGLLDFVEQLSDWMPDAPVLVLAITRPELLERRPGWLVGRRGVVSVRLGPMTEEEMGRLVEGMMGELDPVVRSGIVERAAGVPLYAVELMRSLLTRGLVSRDGTNAAPFDLSTVALPETLQSLIGARIDRLDPVDRSLLQEAAVLGGAFTLPGLAAVSGRSEDAVAARLATLVGRELIEPVRDPRSPLRGGFRFVQEIVREVALSRMSREVKRARHVTAAQYAASGVGPDAAAVAADHYLSALSVTSPGPEADALRSQATDVLFSALERAVELYAHEEVLSLGDRIMDLGLELPSERRLAIDEQLARAANALLKHDVATRHAERAMATSRALGDDHAVRRAAALVALNHLEGFNTEQAIEVIEEQLDGVEDLSSDPELIRLGSLLARARARLFDVEAAMATADRTLAAAEQHELLELIGDTLLTRAGILGLIGRTVESRLLFDGLIRLAVQENLTHLAAAAYNDLGVLGLETSDEDPSLDAIELGRRIGNLWITLVASSNRAENLIGRGEWDEAAEVLADPLWESAPGTMRVTRLQLMAASDAFQGRAREAKAVLNAALDALEADADALFVDAYAAPVRLMSGEEAAAVDWAQRALADPESILWIDPLVRVVLLAGDRRLVEDLASVSSTMRQGLNRWHRDFLQALVAVGADDAPSLAAAEVLIDGAAADGLVTKEVTWTIGLARWLPEGHPDRARLMARARERIDETGFWGVADFLDP